MLRSVVSRRKAGKTSNYMRVQPGLCCAAHLATSALLIAVPAGAGLCARHSWSEHWDKEAALHLAPSERHRDRAPTTGEKSESGRRRQPGQWAAAVPAEQPQPSGPGPGNTSLPVPGPLTGAPPWRPPSARHRSGQQKRKQWPRRKQEKPHFRPPLPSKRRIPEVSIEKVGTRAPAARELVALWCRNYAQRRRRGWGWGLN